MNVWDLECSVTCFSKPSLGDSPERIPGNLLKELPCLPLYTLWCTLYSIFMRIDYFYILSKKQPRLLL